VLAPETSNELLVAVSRGDRDAFARLFSHFAPRIVAILIRDGMASARAEDIAQEAMLSVWRKSASFDPARGLASTWIYAIAKHASVDRHRRDGLQPTPLDLDIHDPPTRHCSRSTIPSGRCSGRPGFVRRCVS
jgi:RNA polymerase sigma-70 factor (ECF subfamily)